MLIVLVVLIPLFFVVGYAFSIGWEEAVELIWRPRVGELDAVVYRIIADRRQAGRDESDLLSMLLSARDDDTGAGMTDRQLRDEVLTMLMAGYETTTSGLTPRTGASRCASPATSMRAWPREPATGA